MSGRRPDDPKAGEKRDAPRASAEKAEALRRFFKEGGSPTEDRLVKSRAELGTKLALKDSKDPRAAGEYDRAQNVARLDDPRRFTKVDLVRDAKAAEYYRSVMHELRHAEQNRDLLKRHATPEERRAALATEARSLTRDEYVKRALDRELDAERHAWKAYFERVKPGLGNDVHNSMAKDPAQGWLDKNRAQLTEEHGRRYDELVGKSPSPRIEIYRPEFRGGGGGGEGKPEQRDPVAQRANAFGVPKEEFVRRLDAVPKLAKSIEKDVKKELGESATVYVKERSFTPVQEIWVKWTQESAMMSRRGNEISFERSALLGGVDLSTNKVLTPREVQAQRPWLIREDPISAAIGVASLARLGAKLVATGIGRFLGKAAAEGAEQAGAKALSRAATTEGRAAASIEARAAANTEARAGTSAEARAVQREPVPTVPIDRRLYPKPVEIQPASVEYRLRIAHEASESAKITARREIEAGLAKGDSLRSVVPGAMKPVYNRLEEEAVLRLAQTRPDSQVLSQVTYVGARNPATGEIVATSELSKLGKGRIADYAEISGNSMRLGEFKTPSAIINSVAGGVKNAKEVAAETYRSTSTIAKQHAAERAVYDKAVELKGTVVVRGTDVKTGQVVTREFSPANVNPRSSVSDYKILPTN